MSDSAPSRDYVQRCFRHFTRFCEGQSPLYSVLSPRAAEDPEILDLACAAQNRQPPVNLVFGAVHYLLLAGARHELADFYPSVGGRRPPDDAYAAFADFCRSSAGRIRSIVATRRVQTNEVGRCGMLLPAFALAWDRFGRRPLHLIEVGCSAGLNLLFDRYRYEYSHGKRCGPPSPARLRIELLDGAAPPLPETLPEVAGRVGVDIAPVEVTDEQATRWVEALIWPDQTHRIELLRAAVSLARPAPPRIVTGDGLQLVPALVDEAPAEALPCVFHSHATCQMSKQWRKQFDEMLADLSRRRQLAHVSLEWLGDDPGPQLHLTACTEGRRQTTHLAECHHHGAWLRWLAR